MSPRNEDIFSVAETMFPRLRAHSTFQVAEKIFVSEKEKMFLNFFRNVSIPQEMLLAHTNIVAETFYVIFRNNVSSFLVAFMARSSPRTLSTLMFHRGQTFRAVFCFISRDFTHN